MYYVEFAMGTIIGPLMFTPQETSNFLISAAYFCFYTKYQYCGPHGWYFKFLRAMTQLESVGPQQLSQRSVRL